MDKIVVTTWTVVILTLLEFSSVYIHEYISLWVWVFKYEYMIMILFVCIWATCSNTDIPLKISRENPKIFRKIELLIKLESKNNFRKNLASLWRVRSILVRAACVRCHGTKCSILMAFVSLLSARVTFLQEGIIVEFRNFAWGFKSQKNNICSD